MPSKPIPELTDRQLKNFWAKVNKRGPDQCWEWSAHKVRGGYGHVRLGPAGMFLAHRVAHYLTTGKQPGPLCACHSCDNPGCCNPAHLFLGTHVNNMADMVAKGRGRYPGLVGVSHGCAKLTEEQVFSIRASGETQYALADKYGVTQHTISRIKSRKTWKHI